MTTEISKLVLMIIAILGLAQAGFLMLLLRHEGKRAFRANRWLMVFAFASCLSFIEDITDVFLTPKWMLIVAPVFMAMTFAFVPSIYLYFREIADRPVSRPIYHFLVLLPVLAATSGMVWILFDQFVPEIIHGSDIDIDIALDQHILLSVLLMSVFVGLYVQLFAYMPKIWKVGLGYLRQAGEQLGADSAALRRWIQEILIGITAIFVIFTVTSVIDLFVEDGTWLTTIVQGSFALVFFRMCHLLASNPALFVQADWTSEDDFHADVSEPAPARNPNPGSSEPAGNNVRGFLYHEDIERIAARLGRVVNETDILFDPLLSMPKLADAIGATPNQLSHVLNQHLGKSFFDFVNEARTREASRLLISEPDRTILDIATSVGFNSKSTFNLAFKKIIGKTPSAYRVEYFTKTNT